MRNIHFQQLIGKIRLSLDKKESHFKVIIMEDDRQSGSFTSGTGQHSELQCFGS